MVGSLGLLVGYRIENLAFYKTRFGRTAEVDEVGRVFRNASVVLYVYDYRGAFVHAAVVDIARTHASGLIPHHHYCRHNASRKQSEPAAMGKFEHIGHEEKPLDGHEYREEHNTQHCRHASAPQP